MWLSCYYPCIWQRDKTAFTWYSVCAFPGITHYYFFLNVLNTASYLFITWRLKKTNKFFFQISDFFTQELFNCPELKAILMVLESFY